MNNFGNDSTQLIATAFVFGLASLAFASLPFIYILINGLTKAKNGQTHSSSIISIFISAFVAHLISCIFFMLGIKLLDVLSAIYEPNYFQNKIFSIFWAREESEVFNLANAKGTMEDKGAYLQLYMVQLVLDWILLLSFWLVIFTATAYGTIQAKKDNMNVSFLQIFVWILISNVVGFFIFVLWAKIASLAMFIPNGEDLLNKIYNMYKEIFNR